jgi:hypothetical protein
VEGGHGTHTASSNATTMRTSDDDEARGGHGVGVGISITNCRWSIAVSFGSK